MALKGNIQNPRGGKPDKLIRDALMAALRQDPNLLKKMAETVVKKASEGDMPAFKEVADRVDGKAPQTIMGDIDNPIAFTNLSESDHEILALHKQKVINDYLKGSK